jgi:hypothetical protein
MLCLDTRTGLWFREDGAQAEWFANCQGEGYFIDVAGDLWSLRYGEKATAFDEQTVEAELEWSAETGDLMDDIRDNKWVSRIQCRVRMDEGASVTVYLQLDGGTWEKVMTVQPAGKRTITLPIASRRCDHLRLRLEGTGEMSLYQLSRYVEQGSEF